MKIDNRKKAWYTRCGFLDKLCKLNSSYKIKMST